MNKTIKIMIIIIFLIKSASAFEKDIMIKVGGNVPVLPKSDSVDETGFDNTYAINLGVHKILTLGFETGFSIAVKKSYPWSSRNRSTEFTAKPSNIFTFPILFTMRLQFDLRKKYWIMPYITPGFGAGLLLFEHPDKGDFFYGYAWQMLGGIILKIKNYTKLELMTELGYRGVFLKDKNEHEIDNSGLLFRIGLRIPFDIDE